VLAWLTGCKETRGTVTCCPHSISQQAIYKNTGTPEERTSHQLGEGSLSSSHNICVYGQTFLGNNKISNLQEQNGFVTTFEAAFLG
jgi:hypothetical protein